MSVHGNTNVRSGSALGCPWLACEIHEIVMVVDPFLVIGQEEFYMLLESFDLENIPLIPLLFQTGYLTFSDYDPNTDKFKLGFPNYEVEDSFKKYVVATLASTSPVVVDTALSQLVREITNNNISNFCLTLKNLYAHVPYSLHGNTNGIDVLDPT